MKRHVTPKQASIEVPSEISTAARAAGIEPGALIGTGNGFDVDEDGYRDFGPCGFCGVGHYIGGPNSMFGECNWCGAV